MEFQLLAGQREKLRLLRHVFFDFDGVFTDNRVFVSEDGTESVACSRSDGLGIEALKKLSIGLTIVSTEANPVVAARARKLRLECFQGCENKHAFLVDFLSSRGLDREVVAFVGNDLNDLEAMRYVGLSACPIDAWPAVRSEAGIVLTRRGGYGAVREFCDLIVLTSLPLAK